MKSVAARLSLVLAVVLYCAPLWAAPTIREQLPTAARVDWDAGMELYAARDYRSALEHFRTAFDKSKNARILFNVGVCWKNLTQYAQATRVWQEQLNYRNKLSPANIQRTEDAIRALAPFVSSLQVVADEPGAKLVVDGIEVGTTPFVDPVLVDVGQRSAKLVKEGFDDLTKSVTVVRDRVAQVVFDLQHSNKTGTVSIVVEGPASAALFMDGTQLGEGGYTGKVPAGKHTFEARADGFTTTRQTSEVLYGQELRLTLAMTEAPNEGKVRILSPFADAQIRIDGNLMGQGAWEGLLPSGGHQLMISKPGYNTEQLELALSPNQQRTVEVDLSPEKSWLFWALSLGAVIAGSSVVGIAVSRASENPAVTGTLGTTVAASR